VEKAFVRRLRRLMNRARKEDVLTFHSKDIKHVSQVVKPTITEKFVVATTEGSPARLEIRLCSDPKPRLVAWEWGSTRLHAG